MIPKNELRINNWVIDETGKPYQIKEGYDIVIADQYQPVELSAEVLEKICLTKDRWNYYLNEVKEIDYIHEDVGYDYVLICAEGIHRLVPIQHLHQLQNLYFSLTGEELTVNL